MNTIQVDNSAWVQISNPGQSVTIFIDADADGSTGDGDIRIFDSVNQPADSEVTNGCRIMSGQTYRLTPPDDYASFWAKATRPGGGAIIQVTHAGIGIPRSVDVSLQDQHTQSVDVFVTRKFATIALNGQTVIDSTTINLAAGHGFVTPVAGQMQMIEISDGTNFYQSRVSGVSGNTITVNNPLPRAFPGDSLVYRSTPDMNKLGSAGTPLLYDVSPPLNVQWDVNVMAINILDQSAMDDSTFGGLPALTNGVIFRTSNGHHSPIFTAVDNTCMIRHCDTDQPYSTKAPSGFYGFNSKRKFNSQQGDGVSKRLGGLDESTFQVLIRDDLTGLDRFWVVLRGHCVS